MEEAGKGLNLNSFCLKNDLIDLGKRSSWQYVSYLVLGKKQ